MGQVKKVHIHKLVTNNTVEERVVDMQNLKNKLFCETIDRDRHQVADGSNGVISKMESLDEDDIKSILNMRLREKKHI